MTDIMTPEQRSRCMAAVKSNDTKPEMIVRRYLHSLGFRYGLHNKKLPGSPDIILRRFKTVIFINGCFWHGHENCNNYRMPKSNVDFWQSKINRNRARDERNLNDLQKLGWRVIVIWECQLKTKELREQTFHEILNILKSTNSNQLYQYSEVAETGAEAAEPEATYGDNEFS